MEFKKGSKTKLKSVRKPLKRNSLDKNAVELFHSNYFARFRFNLDELITYLKESSDKAFADIPQVYQCLDDLGYWSFVRESKVFTFTAELQASLVAQFDLLKESFEYKPSDLLLWGEITHDTPERFLVKIIEKVISDEPDLFRVEVLSSGATLLVSRYELDYWNGCGSSLPVDTLVEAIDWSNDKFWQKRLNDFKLFMINKNFKFNFLSSETELLTQRQELFDHIQSFYSLNEGDLFQRGRGIGLLSCGSGAEHEKLLILTFALQALAQPFGIVSRLWGKVIESNSTPQFLKISFGRLHSLDSINFMNQQAVTELDLRPIQRPLSEVLKKILAKGPFGKWESLISIRPKKNAHQEPQFSTKNDSES